MSKCNGIVTLLNVMVLSHTDCGCVSFKWVAPEPTGF